MSLIEEVKIDTQERGDLQGAAEQTQTHAGHTAPKCFLPLVLIIYIKLHFSSQIFIFWDHLIKWALQGRKPWLRSFFVLGVDQSLDQMREWETSQATELRDYLTLPLGDSSV